jgi:hypothetical protein
MTHLGLGSSSASSPAFDSTAGSEARRTFMIKLTALNYDKPIWVNPRLITAFEPLAGGSVVYFDEGNEVRVSETTDQIAALCPPLSNGDR